MRERSSSRSRLKNWFWCSSAGAVGGQFRHGAIEVVVVVGHRPVLDGEQQRSLLAAVVILPDAAWRILGGLLETDRVSRVRLPFSFPFSFSR